MLILSHCIRLAVALFLPVISSGSEQTEEEKGIGELLSLPTAGDSTATYC